jgi:hypothetical protein
MQLVDRVNAATSSHSPTLGKGQANGLGATAELRPLGDPYTVAPVVLAILDGWGYRPEVSKLNWAASEGAPGYQGVTLHCDLDGDGVIDTSITFSGLTQAQLPTPGYGSVEGYDYIFIG